MQTAASRARRTGSSWAPAALLFLLPLSVLGFAQVSLGLLAGLIGLYPVLLGAGLKHQSFRVITGLTLAVLATAPALMWHATLTPGRTIAGRQAFHRIADLLTAVLIIATILWASRQMSQRSIIAYFAAGLLTQQLLDHSVWKNDPWKYALAFPVAMLLLSIVWKRRRLEVLALLATGLVSVQYDYRGFAGFAAISVILLYFYRRPRTAKSSPIRRIVIVVAVTIAAYEVGVWAALNGDLGSGIQQTSITQTSGGRSLIDAARPEWRAAVALFANNPLGFGPGVVPSANDVLSAEAHLNPNATNSQYVKDYLFGNGIELHSTLSDGWSYYGLFGFSLILYLTFLILRWFAASIARGNLTSVEVFLPVSVLWDAFFSPMSALPRIALGAGLAIAAAAPSCVRSMAVTNGPSSTGLMRQCPGSRAGAPISRGA